MLLDGCFGRWHVHGFVASGVTDVRDFKAKQLSVRHGGNELDSQRKCLEERATARARARRRRRRHARTRVWEVARCRPTCGGWECLE